MSKTNILEKMTAAYDSAMSEKDVGVKLLRLEEIEGSIATACSKSLKDKKKEMEKAGGFGAVSAMIGAFGLTIGTAILTPAAWPGLVDAAIGAATLFGGFVGGGVGAYTVFESRIDRKNAKFVKNIMPYIPAMEDLADQIKQDKKNAMSDIAGLQASTKLSQLVSEHPELVEKFNALNRKEYAEQKATKKLEKEPKGFDL